jgi:hypothetical protein
MMDAAELTACLGSARRDVFRFATHDAYGDDNAYARWLAGDDSPMCGEPWLELLRERQATHKSQLRLWRVHMVHRDLPGHPFNDYLRYAVGSIYLPGSPPTSGSAAQLPPPVDAGSESAEPRAAVLVGPPEQTRILDMTSGIPAHLHVPLTRPSDYWLIDDDLAVVMRYDRYCRFQGAEPVAPAALPYRRRHRDLTWQYSVPVAAWWQAHPECHYRA